MGWGDVWSSVEWEGESELTKNCGQDYQTANIMNILWNSLSMPTNTYRSKAVKAMWKYRGRVFVSGSNLILNIAYYLLSYLRSWALFEKLPVVQPLKIFPASYGTRRFITVFTSTGSYPEPDQSSPCHPISLRSIIIFSIHLRLDLPSGLFPSGFHTNILYAFHFPPIRATVPAHPILLLVNYTSKFNLFNLSVVNSLQFQLLWYGQGQQP
jgi:hypothetical protein